MATSILALRALGARNVALVTADGTFSGVVDQTRLSDGAIMVMLEPEGGTGVPVVVAIDAITEIVER